MVRRSLSRTAGVKNKTGETFKCRISPSCPRQHASDLSQVSRADVVKKFGFIKGFIGTAGGGLAKDAKKGTWYSHSVMPSLAHRGVVEGHPPLRGHM